MNTVKIEWEKRYSFDDKPDRLGRWMRIGRINDNTVAIMGKNEKHPFPQYAYYCRVPYLGNQEGVTTNLSAGSEDELKIKVEAHLREYIKKITKNFQ